MYLKPEKGRISTMSQSDGLTSAFAGLEPPLKEALADIDKPLMLALAALLLAEDRAGAQRLTAADIVTALEAADVSVTEKQVAGALAMADALVSRKVIASKNSYSLMTVGRRRVQPLLSIGPIQVSYIEAGSPRSSRMHLAEMLTRLKGPICICDPYYGARSLESLAQIPQPCASRFLTSTTTESPAKLAGPLQDFHREHPNVEMRMLATPNTLHDRYIVTQDSLFLMGQGIKDIGNKDSFIVVISRSYAADAVDEVDRRFARLWAIATPI
jgi:hypothetical protein